MRFGHLLDIGEITPNIFLKLDRISRVRAFITLYNSCVEDDLKLPLYYAKFKSVKAAFKARIDDLLKFKNGSKTSKFCVVSNLIILAYKQKRFEKIININAQPKYPVAKMIKMLYLNGKFELCFDANFMFSQFVYDKISHKNCDKEINFCNNFISISQKGKKLLCVLPSFKDFNVGSANKLSKEMDLAVKAVRDYGFERVYVVMPRNTEFKRHIEVRHCECGGSQIKLVPYTISNKIY